MNTKLYLRLKCISIYSSGKNSLKRWGAYPDDDTLFENPKKTGIPRELTITTDDLLSKIPNIGSEW